MLATAGSSVLVQAVRVARRPMPAYVAAWERTFVFSHPGELLVGAGLLYYFRCSLPQIQDAERQLQCCTAQYRLHVCGAAPRV